MSTGFGPARYWHCLRVRRLLPTAFLRALGPVLLVLFFLGSIFSWLIFVGLILFSLIFEDCELDFLFHRIDAVNQYADAVAEAVGVARALADDLSRVFVVSVAVVDQRIQRDQAFDEEVG